MLRPRLTCASWIRTWLARAMKQFPFRMETVEIRIVHIPIGNNNDEGLELLK